MAVAVERNGIPIMLHTHYNNTVARHLIEQNRIPGLEGAAITKAEHTIGHSRFDFLLRKGNRDILLEVKSCTLFNRTWPCSPTRSPQGVQKHLLELASLSRKGLDTAVLFIVHAPNVQYFMPEHHTDLVFSQTLLSVRDRVMAKAVSVGWNDDLTIGNDVRELTIPWDMVKRESHDSGSYIIVLRLEQDRRISVGSIGDLKFRKGFYLYVGSAKKDLTRRINRHRSERKNLFWHIDYLREHAEFHAALPIRASADLECEIAASMSKIADWRVDDFGSSDCSCESHLFGMKDDPVHSQAFIKRLLYFRMGRLEEKLAEGIG